MVQPTEIFSVICDIILVVESDNLLFNIHVCYSCIFPAEGKRAKRKASCELSKTLHESWFVC